LAAIRTNRSAVTAPGGDALRKLAQTIVSGAVPRQASRSAMLTVAMAALMAAFAIVATIYVR